MKVVDEYGIDRDEAERLFEAYLRDTAGDPAASLEGLRLEDGRWQAAVVGSRRRLATVFLNQHTGRVVVGHTSAEGPPVHAPTEEAAFRHAFYPAADLPESQPNQTIAYPSAVPPAEEAIAGGMEPTTLKFRDQTRHRAIRSERD
ncbi:MAG: hypothetical protein FJZ01_05145 [Candidatus Sericytochromatia bacterium]|nr:hypothetical protein [Candidatus Tanganyikabacteria bacterium]